VLQTTLLKQERSQVYKLRPYQTAAIQAGREEIAHQRKPLIVLATGLGKTVLFAEMVRITVKMGGRALVIAHRIELLDQAADKLRALGIDAAIEQGPRKAGCEEAIVASVQTLKGKRLAAWPRDAFSLIVVDEAHHATASAYRAVFDHFDAPILGVTATPDRTDGVALGEIFDSVPVSMQLPDAVDEGWLVPIDAQTVQVEALDLSELRKPREAPDGDRVVESKQEAMLGRAKEHVVKDWTDSELAKVIEPVLPAVVKPLVELIENRQTLLFLPGRVCCDAAASMIRAAGVSAQSVTSKTLKGLREQWISDYKAGRIQVLVNCGVFTEGFDAPSTEVIAICRPTKSRSLYAQIVGRGTRPADSIARLLNDLVEARERRELIAESEKPACTVLHFQGSGVGHQLIGPIDLFAGKGLDPDVRVEAEKRLSKKERITDALAEAKASVNAKRKAEAEAAARKRQEKLLKVADIRYTVDKLRPPTRPVKTHEHNPWSAKPVEAKDLDGSITMDTLRWLVKTIGVREEVAREWSEKHAQYMRRQFFMRNAGPRLCTYKQARTLRSYGVPTHNLSAQRASVMMTALEGYRFQPPPDWLEKLQERMTA
jgi:superfamily II DNA or RNA helicase